MSQAAAAFDPSLDLYIVPAIAVLGPAGMIAMDRLVRGAVARGWLERATGSPSDRVAARDVMFMCSFVVVTGVLAMAAQLVMFHGRSLPIDGGTYTIVVRAVDHEPWTGQVEVGVEGDFETVKVP